MVVPKNWSNIPWAVVKLDPSLARYRYDKHPRLREMPSETYILFFERTRNFEYFEPK